MEEEAKALRGEVTGLEVEEEEVAIIVTTTREAPALSNLGVTPCWLGVPRPGASTIPEEGVRGGVGEAQEG